MQYWTNGTVTLQCGQIQNRHNICRIKPYKYDTNVEDINPENMYDDVNLLLPVIYFRFKLNIGKKYIIE